MPARSEPRPRAALAMIVIASSALIPAPAQTPDKIFHEFMSQWMDRRVDGAIGGNAFATLKISVDYPNGVAVFER